MGLTLANKRSHAADEGIRGINNSCYRRLWVSVLKECVERERNAKQELLLWKILISWKDDYTELSVQDNF